MPELFSRVGLPAAVFISVTLDSPKNGIIKLQESNGTASPWRLTIDTAQLLNDVVVSPIQSYIGKRGVVFAAYLTGIVKKLELPVLHLALDCFFNTAKAEQGILISEVSAIAPSVMEAQPPTARQDICPHCLRCERDNEWILVGRPE